MIQTPLEHTTQSINGINLHVVQAGPVDGRPLLLLHGFPEFWYSWRNQIDPLVEAGFRLWMPDQRGYNLSDKPDDLHAYNLDVLADDIYGLLEVMGADKGDVIAHDWGGAALWWAAARHPERFNRILLLNIPHHSAFRKALNENPSQRRKSVYMAYFQLPILPEISARLFNWRLLASWAFGRSNAFTPDDIALYKRTWGQPGAITSMLNWYRAIRQSRTRKMEDHQIHVPLRLVWGKDDFAFDWTLAQASIDLCDDADLVLVEGASHWVQHEAPDLVTENIIDFFG